MEIETPTKKGKAQKRNVEETEDVKIEYVHTRKNTKTKEVEEEEIKTRLNEIKLNQLGFHVTLQDPLRYSSSSSIEVQLLSSVGN